MKTELVEDLLTLKVDMVATLATAILLLLLGYWLIKKVAFFRKFCIPAPVIGGLLFSILALVLKQSGLITISMDTTFQSPFMIAFFTTIGLGASFKLLKKGGKCLIIYWLLCGVLAISQNVIGIVFAKITGIHPMFGIMAGSVSMEGGHGAAAAFGKTAEAMGIAGSTTVAIAAATFGLISGGLIGGPIAKHLIDKHKLKPSTSDNYDVKSFENVVSDTGNTKITTNMVMAHMAIITVCMTIGSIASGWFSTATGLSLPGYVGAMFVSVAFRNINDKIHIAKLDYYTIDLMGNVSLGIFLSMALMTLKLWELVGLAGPLLIIVTAQVIFMILYTVFVVFKFLGKDFDAAVMAAGMAGHGLGATPNAIANMGAVTEKYGPSPKAFLIVPLVGAFLIDLIGIPTIVFFMNFFK
ncbi:sodium/glutamate symporter [Clostridium sp. CM028]|uniref:sodium/glutamate symporter n=1 Tax=unclassified Clostridium TaxID=2614128 RepID=UPI001C6E48C3|nr:MULTISPECIES: sodium/glutamate symporter [unclassified Clostridium]MBW9146892.1 sodium/glutamate symporter [Clostridium sp. CM027]MBW9148084.1 sodium/glutamate symporter [Clostridium sp. CM028]UVE40841.1 sodium/glutamate symporter [Clostridium sp. CM027]WLC61507.1 sodium/glutamate symporter [Clostridium sp. CM028]